LPTKFLTGEEISAPENLEESGKAEVAGGEGRITRSLVHIRGDVG